MDRTRNQGQKPLKGIVYVWQGKGKGHCQLHKGLMMWHGVVALCTLSFFFWKGVFRGGGKGRIRKFARQSTDECMHRWDSELLMTMMSSDIEIPKKIFFLRLEILLSTAQKISQENCQCLYLPREKVRSPSNQCHKKKHLCSTPRPPRTHQR